MILLTTSDIHVVTDDGKSHNFEKRGEEQQSFIDAFNKSAINNKLMVDVYDKWADFYKPKHLILKDVVNWLNSV